MQMRGPGSSARPSARSDAAGDHARAIAPPRYGIDFIDRGMLPRQRHMKPALRPKGAPIDRAVLQMVKRSGRLTVRPAVHPKASATIPDGEDEVYRVGFEMPVELEVKPGYTDKASSALEFRQYAKDAYDFDLGDGKSDKHDSKSWKVDQYGFTKAKGEWDSSSTAIWWKDEPGWNGNNGTVLASNQRLRKYQIMFFWTVKERKGALLHRTKAITLTATADGKDIAYDVKDQTVDDKFAYGEDDPPPTHEYPTRGRKRKKPGLSEAGDEKKAEPPKSETGDEKMAELPEAETGVEKKAERSESGTGGKKKAKKGRPKKKPKLE